MEIQIINKHYCRGLGRQNSRMESYLWITLVVHNSDPPAPISLLTVALYFFVVLFFFLFLTLLWSFRGWIETIFLVPYSCVLAVCRNGCHSSLNGGDWANTWLVWDNVYREQREISALFFPNFTFNSSSVFHPGKSEFHVNSQHSLCHVVANTTGLLLFCYRLSPSQKWKSSVWNHFHCNRVYFPMPIWKRGAFWI